MDERLLWHVKYACSGREMWWVSVNWMTLWWYVKYACRGSFMLIAVYILLLMKFRKNIILP